MKSLFIATLFLFSTHSVLGQNKNVKDETKTTTTTVTDSKGEKTYVKKENTREVQNIELKEQEPKNINMDLKDSPVVIENTTTVTNPDGSTRTVDIDRSSVYLFNNKKYDIALDSKGYRILSEDGKEKAFLRKTTTNSFIYHYKNNTAIAYFDVEGNLVLEKYNSNSDTISFEKYIPLK